MRRLWRLSSATSFPYNVLWTAYFAASWSRSERDRRDGSRKDLDPKGKGLTIDLFTKESLKKLKGETAIGHVRYSTAGGQENANIQPIVARGLKEQVAVVHNGQIVNEKELRIELEKEGCIFQGTSDSEIILHNIQKKR